MASDAFNALRQLMPKRAVPEDSIGLRVAVAAAVLASMIGLVSQDIVKTSTAIVVLAATPIGFLISYRRRKERNISLKIALAAGAVLALANFLQSVSGATSVEAARAPLAEIFLFVQALHSFDLPRRRDLHFSLASSITLISLGGSLAFDSTFLVYFLPWGLFALVALQLAHVSEVTESARKTGGPVMKSGSWRPNGALIAATLAIVAVASAGVFVFAPRAAGSRLTSLTFRIPNLLPIPQGAGIVNPGLPNGGPPGERPTNPVGGAYFGFANFVDLRVRAELSDEVVMRVRAPRPATWRGAVFDVYSKSAWSDSTPKTEPLIGLPIEIPPERRTATTADKTELIQTFFIERQQPNIIFAAAEAKQVFFPVRQVELTDHQTIRSGVLLDEGTAYSVVSQLPRPSPAELQGTVADLPEEMVERYTQLPPEISARVRNLAHEIAGDEPSILGKAQAVESWLRTNTEYLIKIPPQPRGTEAVDHFLFEDRRGFCEYIATSMAVLLRAQGVPTRFATGYAPGERNLLSGFYEVKQTDAHAWVEVYLPNAGWVEFDPTFGVPKADDPSDKIPGIGLLRDAGKTLAKLIPRKAMESVASALREGLVAVASSGRSIAMTLIVAALVITALRFLWPRVVAGLKKVRLRRTLGGSSKRAVAGAFQQMESAGRQAGVPREPSATPREYGQRLSRGGPGSIREDVERVVRALEEDLYSGEEVEDSEARAVVQAAERITAALAGRSSVS